MKIIFLKMFQESQKNTHSIIVDDAKKYVKPIFLIFL